MQRASLCRYDKGQNILHLMPQFYEYVKGFESQIDQILSGYANIQKASLFYGSDSEVSSLISGMVRSIRALPLICKQEPHTTLLTRPSILTARTCYDLVYHFFSDKEVEFPKEFLEKLIEAFGCQDKWEIQPYCDGFALIDKTIEKTTTLQSKSIYEIPAAPESIPELQMLETPGAHTIDDLANFTKLPTNQLIKAVMYEYNGKLVFCNIRGDLDVSEDKLRHFLGLVDSTTPLNLAPQELLDKHGLVPGFAGIIGIKRAGEAIIICDDSVKTVHCGVTGANKVDYHWINYNIPRDTKKVAKNIVYADIAENKNEVKGAILAEVAKCVGFPAEVLGSDSKPVKTPLFKVTVRLIDLVYSLIEKVPFNGCYVINLLKTDDKLNLALAEISKVFSYSAVVVDNRPKANFGAKMDAAKLSLLKYVVIASNKTDDDAVMVNDNPVKIAELVNYLKQ